ncbi:MAG: hypothetical protein JWO38_750 [Gemmataceae bacterium]|nr:hypothetical protein [Gemmataceae bacterium]
MTLAKLHAALSQQDSDIEKARAALILWWGSICGTLDDLTDHIDLLVRSFHRDDSLAMLFFAGMCGSLQEAAGSLKDTASLMRGCWPHSALPAPVPEAVAKTAWGIKADKRKEKVKTKANGKAAPDPREAVRSK